MAENKKSFVLYADLLHTVRKMPSDKAGDLFKHILEYVNDEEPETDDLIVEIAFEPIKQQLKRDLKKYENKRKQWSEAGKRSAEVRKKQRTLTNVKNRSTDLTVNDSVNVNVNDIYKRKGIKEKVAFDKCTPNNYQLEDFNDFLGYWFEHGERDKKMRFEKQKSFDWKRRWNTWLKNKNKWEKEKNVAPKKEKLMLADKMKQDYGIK